MVGIDLPSWALFFALMGVVALERLMELRISRRHARWALVRGGVEYGREHFRWMALLHTAFLIAAPLEVWFGSRPFLPGLGWTALGLAAAAQGLRYWAIASLGRYWNVRVVVVPGSTVQVKGPYRFLRHPNYLAVVIEGLALPLIHTAYVTAVMFTILNAWILMIRIRCEEEALSVHCDYQQRLGSRSRFFPGVARS